MLDGVSDDPFGVSLELLSIIDQAGLVDFKQMAQQVQDSFTPQNAIKAVLSVPAIMTSLAAINPTIDNLADSLNALEDITDRIASLSVGVRSVLYDILSFMYNAIFEIVETGAILGGTGVGIIFLTVLTLIFVGSLITFLATTLFHKYRVFKRSSAQCNADLMQCEYEQFLLDTVPTFFKIAFLGESGEAP